MKCMGKPVVEAFRLGVDYIPDWFMEAVTKNAVILHGTSTCFYNAYDTNADINTSKGTVHADFGDYIILSTDGEIYPCKPDAYKEIFENRA